MPVYVYQCAQCDYQFEQQQKFSDTPLKKCPNCGKLALHKVYTPVGIIYKGSGFYSTDHRSSSGTSHASSKKTGDSKQSDSDSKAKASSPSEAKS